MVDGVSFLNTGIPTGGNGTRADASRSVVADPNTVVLAVPVAGASTPAAPDDSTKVSLPQPAKEQAFSPATQATLLKTQEDQNSSSTQAPTRTKQEVTAAVKTFDDTQALRNQAPPQQEQKPEYATAGVKVNV